MSLHHLGKTRSRRAPDHFLQTPDTFVWAPLPGMVNATACVHCAPALGASFAMYSVALDRGGVMESSPASRFVYVQQGSMLLHMADREESLGTSAFAFVPPEHFHVLTTMEAETRAIVIEKHYVPLAGVPSPDPLVSSEAEITGCPLLGDAAIQVKALLPDTMSFDLAVNVMEYQPGASLGRVESHVMEHGLVMLDGEGIYRLGDSWYPVAKGDFIWMGAFCPQWFAALGKQPAKYLIYKDWNRHPLAGVAR